MSHDLPASVRAAILDLTAGRAGASLVSGQGALSAGYRAGRASSETVRGGDDVAAYLIARMPATYAAVHRALSELQARVPAFSPRVVADIGCGPGTASLAALACFDEIERIAGVDGNAAFLAMAPQLIAASGLAGNVDFTAKRGDFRSLPATTDASDLTILAYALVECEEHAAAQVVRRLYDLTRDVLVLVEPGSRAGFARIRAARNALIAAGAQIVGPCTHAASCPMVDPDWCHFSVRLSRSRAHRHIKQADAPFEDEKFSYLIARRAAPVSSTDGRILAPAYHGKGGSQFRICTASGVEAVTLRARDVAHKTRRKLDWGDIFPQTGPAEEGEAV